MSSILFNIYPLERAGVPLSMLSSLADGIYEDFEITELLEKGNTAVTHRSP
jgi:hypothetical protein